MHDTNFTYKETRQSVRESQQIELRTAGMFEVQRLEVSINISAITGDEDPMVVVEWGGRESQPMSVMQLGMFLAVFIIVVWRRSFSVGKMGGCFFLQHQKQQQKQQQHTQTQMRNSVLATLL